MKTIAFYCQGDKRVKNDYFLDNYDDTNEYVRLRNELVRDGYDVHSLDIYQKQNIIPNICIFLDIPTFSINKIIDKKTKTIAFLREAEIISSINYDKNRHKEFDKILTWKKDLIDNNKYFYISSTRFVKKDIEVKNFNDRKLCVLVNSNLSSNIKGELYSKRLEFIKWFEKNALNDFDLYGFAWDKWNLKIRDRTIFSTKLFAPKRLSYKGIADDKLKVMSRYKFSICFENTNIVKDYISEKIFDSFFAKSVPIYWGAPNIEEYIPKNCFIDFRDFKSFEECYNYIKNMNEKEYLEYISNIENFLNSEKINPFLLNSWVENLKKVIKEVKE